MCRPCTRSARRQTCRAPSAAVPCTRARSTLWKPTPGSPPSNNPRIRQTAQGRSSRLLPFFDASGIPGTGGEAGLRRVPLPASAVSIPLPGPAVLHRACSACGTCLFPACPKRTPSRHGPSGTFARCGPIAPYQRSTPSVPVLLLSGAAVSLLHAIFWPIIY